eukprot:TRINITY_DN7906_c0_g2_i1.p1 TRINITY_DN7906_c0_g2~~TRINITY_DN7906_c0_g2_i1.p1  ORF type:complete len:155 (-),score=16.62 TRINITY_DN7906_c0_g2_i1:146-610(-)
MASLCGFFVLAIFSCSFHYDEALRRDADDEALISRASSELGRASSDRLALRFASVNANLVRSHDTSLFFKRGGEEKPKEPRTWKFLKWMPMKSTPVCPVKLPDSTCELEWLSPDCCYAKHIVVCKAAEKLGKPVTSEVCDNFSGIYLTRVRALV